VRKISAEYLGKPMRLNERADDLLNFFARGIERILIDMKVPGVRWLSLC
jgi:hypothetical protein